MVLDWINLRKYPDHTVVLNWINLKKYPNHTDLDKSNKVSWPYSGFKLINLIKYPKLTVVYTWTKFRKNVSRLSHCAPGSIPSLILQPVIFKPGIRIKWNWFQERGCGGGGSAPWIPSFGARTTRLQLGPETLRVIFLVEFPCKMLEISSILTKQNFDTGCSNKHRI